MLKGHLNILGHFWQRLTSLDNHRKSLEVVGTFLEILDIKRRKSHAFNSFIFTKNLVNINYMDCSQCQFSKVMIKKNLTIT